jgi:hypothetical protein
MPPENAGYMYVAYGAAVFLYAGYALSIWWRYRDLVRRACPPPVASEAGDAR